MKVGDLQLVFEGEGSKQQDVYSSRIQNRPSLMWLRSRHYVRLVFYVRAYVSYLRIPFFRQDNARTIERMTYHE